MAFKLMEQEAKYLDLLKETKMLQHTGSGPVDPAPKEKETKSPVEDGTGAGTKQSSTGHPNVIPPIAYLKKELAKEGIDLQGETQEDLIAEISALSNEDRAVIKQKLSEEGIFAAFKAGRQVGKQAGSAATSAKKAVLAQGLSKKAGKTHGSAAAIRSLRKEPVGASKGDIRDIIASKRNKMKEALALEGIKIYGDDLQEWVEQLKALSEDQKVIARTIISEMKDEEKCPTCDCDPCTCESDDKDKEDDEGKEDEKKK